MFLLSSRFCLPSERHGVSSLDSETITIEVPNSLDEQQASPAQQPPTPQPTQQHSQHVNASAHLPLSEAQTTLNAFWPTILDEIKRIKTVDAKNQGLPLARIKKIMKLDDDVKMISAEAPLLFAKAAEIFIHELTLRAWVHTEDNKRRTLQRNDIAMAITKYDQFDFLIDIVPREEIVKPPRRDTLSSVAMSTAAAITRANIEAEAKANQLALATSTTAAVTTTAATPQQMMQLQLQQQQQQQLGLPPGATAAVLQSGEPVQYYLQLAQQHQQALQGQQPQQQSTTATTVQQQQQQQQLHGQTMHIMQSPQQSQPQQQQQIQHVQMASLNGGAITLGSTAPGLMMQPQHQQIQLVQQIVTPNGEITHVPVSGGGSRPFAIQLEYLYYIYRFPQQIQIPQNQLNMLRMQMQQGQTHLNNHLNQPIILAGQQMLQVNQQATPQQQQQQQASNNNNGISNNGALVFQNPSAVLNAQQQQQQQPDD